MASVAVLCYHAVSPTWGSATSVTPDAFRDQLAFLTNAGYRGDTLVGALTAPKSEKTVVVTFDDAHRSVLDYARPILDDLRLPATVFAPTDYPGSGRAMGWAGYDEWLGTEHEHELGCLSWEELRGLSDSGWEIGSHTCSHPKLTTLSDAELERELVESRRICEERIGSPCVSLAYPYSDEDDRVVRATRRAGYGLAVTVAHGHERPLPLRWPRDAVYQGESVLRMRARMGRRRWPAVDTVAGSALRAGRAARSMAAR